MKAVTQEITKELLNILEGGVIIAAMLAVVVLLVYVVMGLASNEPSASPPLIATERRLKLTNFGRSTAWLKIKNPAAPAVRREAEEEWN